MPRVAGRILDHLGFVAGATEIERGYLTVILWLRTVVLLGALARTVLHLEPGATPGRWLALAVLGAFTAHVAALAWLRWRRPAAFRSEPVQIGQLVVDVGLIAGLYFVTGEVESDFFLFFSLPLLLPTTMDGRLRSVLAPGLVAGALLGLVLVMPQVYDVTEEASPLRDLIRVFAPRMVFLALVSLLVNLAFAYRRVAVAEQRQRTALQELLSGMQRQAAVEVRATPAAVASPGPGTGSGPRLQVGAKVGLRYSLLGRIGRGGMGEVFQAHDLELDDIVALKVLDQSALPRGTQGILMLRREIRLQRWITHPNVTRVHDLGEADGIQFLTMEYLTGSTLRSMLGHRAALPVEAGLTIFKQLCSGLAAVHAEDILHRDLKPENVMVLPNGLVKLMDFGVAQLVRDEDAGDDGEILAGSPLYMSPEQFRREELDPRCDLYALGVILYEAFTGQHPFPGRSTPELILAHLETPPPPPSVLAPELPDRLAKLMLACLEKDRRRRPSAAPAVYQALCEV